MTTPPYIHVAVGIIINAKKQLLVAKRPMHVDQGGLWEFPGGKLEKNEDVYSALCRELKEELNLEVLAATPFLKKPHVYPSCSVLLDAWRVEEFQGELFGVEGQIIRWVSLEELRDLPVLPGNLEIIDAISLLALFRKGGGEV